MAVQSFLHFWPVKHCHSLGWCLLEGIRFQTYQMLSLLGPMQGWRVWVALAELGVSYRSQPYLQARWAEEKVAILWAAITLEPEGLKTLLLHWSLVGSVVHAGSSISQILLELYSTSLLTIGKGLPPQLI
jgi:hypothetical protein